MKFDRALKLIDPILKLIGLWRGRDRGQDFFLTPNVEIISPPGPGKGKPRTMSATFAQPQHKKI